MSGLEIAPLVMSVLPPAIEYFFAQDAVSMDEGDEELLPRGSKAPRVVFQSHASSKQVVSSRRKFVRVTSLSLEEDSETMRKSLFSVFSF